MKIMCLGDSLTFGDGVDSQDNWVSRTAQKTGWTLTNKGINGDTTGGMLARFRLELAEDSFDAVMIMGGTNDVFVTGSAAAAKTNIVAICRQAAHLGLQPVAGIPTPMNLDMVDPIWGKMVPLADMMTALAEYRQWLMWFGKAYGVPVIDFWSAFPESRQGVFLPDGLHPNPEGHRLMAETLLARLPEIFRN